MFSTLFIVAAAASAYPSLPSVKPALADEDYPGWALSESASAGALLRIETSASGSVKKCTVRSHVGDERLAQAMCAIASRNTVRPARDSNGVAVPAVFDAEHHWMIPKTPQGNLVATRRFRPQPQVELSVVKLPSGQSEAQIPVAVSYGADGRFTGCAAMDATVDPALTQAACRTLASSVGESVRDETGARTPYVTRMDVHFRAGAGQ